MTTAACATSISELSDSFAAESRKKRKKKNLIKKIHYEVRRALENSSTKPDHLATIVRTVDELIADGIKPSSTQLRDPLLPLLNDLEDVEELSDAMIRVIREFHRFLSRNPTADPSVASQQKYSDDVRLVADKFRSKKVVLIGGEMRRQKKEQIESAFELEELVWKSTREHSPLGPIESDVRKADVVAVFLAIRWSSHSYSNVIGICNDLGKPLVRLPAGTNPNQIAHAVMEQAMDRL